MQKAIFKLLIFAAGLALFPFFLRRRWRVGRRILIRATPGAIFPYLNDLSIWPEWTAWTCREKITVTYSGPQTGIGATQQWTSGRIDGVLQITQSHPDERIAYELDMGEGRYHIDGAISLEPVGTFTRVTWICSWTGDPNPYARYLDLIFKIWIGRDFDGSLVRLRELVEGKAELVGQP